MNDRRSFAVSDSRKKTKVGCSRGLRHCGGRRRLPAGSGRFGRRELPTTSIVFGVVVLELGLF